MVKQMFIKNGESIVKIDLVIDTTDLDFFKFLMDYYPIWKDIEKEGIIVSSFEKYAEELKFDVKKDTWIVSKLLDKILNETNPLVISDSYKKLCEYVPKNEKEKYFVENIFNRFSYKMCDIKMKKDNSFINSVAVRNYCYEDSSYDEMVNDMIDDELEFNPELSNRKKKRIMLNIKKSIPKKSCLF